MESTDAPILIIDDDDGVRRSMSRLLRSTGIESIGVPDAEKGLSVLRRGRERHARLPVLIVLDLGLPGMAAEEFRQAQLGDGRLAHIPVIVVSAAAREGTGQGALRRRLLPQAAGRRLLSGARAFDRFWSFPTKTVRRCAPSAGRTQSRVGRPFCTCRTPILERTAAPVGRKRSRRLPPLRTHQEGDRQPLDDVCRIRVAEGIDRARLVWFGNVHGTRR
jgi:CheY-like chemotaxis protein